MPTAYNQTILDLLPEAAEMERFQQSLLFRGLKTDDTGLPNRVLSHWKREGLLLQRSNERKWVRLNLIEYIWLKMVEDMRLIGISFFTIRLVKDALLKGSPLVEGRLDTVDNIERNHQLIKESLGWDDEKIILGLNKLKTPEVEKLTQDSHFTTPLSFLIMCAALLHKKTGVYIPYDGQPLLFWDSDSERTSHNPRLDSPYVYFPIHHYLRKVWDSPLMEDKLTKLQLLSDDELMVLRAIRNQDFKEIIIKPEKNTDNKQKYKLTTITHGELTPEKERQITEILGLKKYQSITLNKRSNTQIYFERKHTK